MSHPADTPALIYDNLVATILRPPHPQNRPPMTASIETPQADHPSETPLFDSLNAEWISRRPTLATASLGTPAGAPCDHS